MFDDIDMSIPSQEFMSEPAQVAEPYNSYQDVNNSVVENYSGVNPDAAGLSNKEMNFNALRDEAAKFKAEREYWKGQAEAYSKIHQSQPDQPEALDSLDLDNSDDMKKAWNSIRQDNQRFREEIKDTLASIQAKSNHNNWDQVVSSHIPQLTNSNPIFAEMIRNSSDPYEAAYQLAALNSKAQNHQVPISDNAQRAMNNAAKPQTLASVGGRGQLSAADYYASMSDKDFMAVAAKNLGNI